MRRSRSRSHKYLPSDTIEISERHGFNLLIAFIALCLPTHSIWKIQFSKSELLLCWLHCIFLHVMCVHVLSAFSNRIRAILKGINLFIDLVFSVQEFVSATTAETKTFHFTFAFVHSIDFIRPTKWSLNWLIGRKIRTTIVKTTWHTTIQTKKAKKREKKKYKSLQYIKCRSRSLRRSLCVTVHCAPCNEKSPVVRWPIAILNQYNTLTFISNFQFIIKLSFDKYIIMYSLHCLALFSSSCGVHSSNLSIDTHTYIKRIGIDYLDKSNDHGKMPIKITHSTHRPVTVFNVYVPFRRSEMSNAKL